MKKTSIRAGRIRSLKPVLQKWVALNRTLYQNWGEKDCPWWYNERAILSIFAGAIWRSGGLAFEEFSNLKTKKSRRRSRYRKYAGRSDLYFQVKRKEYVVEVKSCESGATASGGDPAKQVNRLLGEARREVRKSEAEEQGKLAIVFALPYIKDERRDTVGRLLESWIRKIEQGVKHDCLAWVFAWDPHAHTADGYLLPGIALVGREVKKSPK